MGAFYLDIKKDLLDKILSGVYQQGSIIPNEYELAEKMCIRDRSYSFIEIALPDLQLVLQD